VMPMAAPAPMRTPAAALRLVAPVALPLLAAPVTAPAQAPKRTEAVELPAALEYASRYASSSALALLRVTSAAAVAEAERAGGPPGVESTADVAELPDEFAARVTIFDEAAAEAEAEDDGLYNLVAEELDAGEEPADAAVDSLDEEFSRQALLHEAALAMAQVEDALPETLPEEVPEIAVPVVAPPLTALSSIAALRRPAMTHSVAVIVARGADF